MLLSPSMTAPNYESQPPSLRVRKMILHIISRRIRRIQNSSSSVAIICNILPANWEAKDVEFILGGEMDHLSWAVWLIVGWAKRAVCSGWLLISLRHVRSGYLQLGDLLTLVSAPKSHPAMSIEQSELGISDANIRLTNSCHGYLTGARRRVVRRTALWRCHCGGRS